MLVWFFYFGVMFAFFLTPLINVAMEHMALMDVFNLAFLLAGCLYWWPVVGLDPIVHWRMGYGTRLANLALGVPFEAFLGVAIMSQRTALSLRCTRWSSTHSGGGLLWAATELAIFVGLDPDLHPVGARRRAGRRRADARADRAHRARNGPGTCRTVPAGLAAEVMGSGSPTVERFRPLFQPGNSSWEELWKAKAGFVPSTSGRPGSGREGAIVGQGPQAGYAGQGPPAQARGR